MKHSSVAIIGVGNLFREGLQGLLRRSKFEVVFSAASFDEVRGDLSTVTPDLAIFAVSRGDDLSGRIEQIRSCHEAFGSVRIVLLTDRLPIEGLRDAAMAGAQAVLSKDITAEVLQRALELVMLGQQLFPAQPDESPPPRGSTASLVPFARPGSSAIQASGDGRGPGNGTTKSVVHTIFSEVSGIGRTMSLSERERQILRCLMDGAANKTIARQLTITEATVKVHIKGLLRKIRVNNRTQAAVWGLNNTEVFGQGPVIDGTDRAAEPLIAC